MVSEVTLKTFILMATGNLFLGMARKSVGDVVFYHADGQQRSRVRNRNPKNPKSPAQCVQRMVLSTASKIAQAYRPIINHSFEGVAVGTASERYFQKITMKALRNAALWLGDESIDNPVHASFDIKGAPTVGIVDGMTISKGSLSFNSYSVGAEAENTLTLSCSEPMSSQTFSTQAAYVAELAKIGLVPGDQLSIVMHVGNLENRVASFENGHNFAQAVRFARVTFVKEIPANFSGALFSEGGKWNPALIEKAEGEWPEMLPVAGDNPKVEMTIAVANFPDVVAAGLIRSQYDEVGKCHYSTCKMLADSSNIDDNNANWVWPSYADGAQVLMVGDPLFLRNAVASLA